MALLFYNPIINKNQNVELKLFFFIIHNAVIFRKVTILSRTFCYEGSDSLLPGLLLYNTLDLLQCTLIAYSIQSLPTLKTGTKSWIVCPRDILARQGF